MRSVNDDITTTESPDAASNQKEDAGSERPKSGEVSTIAAENNGSTNEEADVANLVDGNLSGEDVNNTTASRKTLERISAPVGEKATVDGDDANGTQNALSHVDKSEHLGGDGPTAGNVEITAEQDGEAKAPESSGQTGQEQSPDEVDDDDDDDDEGGRRYPEIFEEPVEDGVEAPTRPKRYELSYWPYHLASAEKLWTVEEREKSDEWKELWNLVTKFLCESPDAFKIWQQHYMELGEKYEVYSTLLSPLQVAVACGIKDLVKILLDRGEPAAAETEDGRSALWFATSSPDIEIIKLLLENGASPNACKDFPPPFHNVLRSNPNFGLVELMLEHGADCKITDKWGFNAMHWFAMCCSEVEVLKALLKAHGDINIPDASGETPLHALMYNVQGLSLGILHAFLENGADVNKDDKDSQSKP